MKFKLVKIHADTWASNFAEKAHAVTFNKVITPENERVDFAILAINFLDEPVGYITCRELGRGHLYWQFGGIFPNARGTIYSYGLYEEAKKMCLNEYNRITTFIENSNTTMLKMALKVGFRITGLKLFNDQILLEHTVKNA